MFSNNTLIIALFMVLITPPAYSMDTDFVTQYNAAIEASQIEPTYMKMLKIEQKMDKYPKRKDKLAPRYAEACQDYRLAIRHANLPGNIPCEQAAAIKEEQDNIEQEMNAASEEARRLPITLPRTRREIAQTQEFTPAKNQEEELQSFLNDIKGKLRRTDNTEILQLLDPEKRRQYVIDVTRQRLTDNAARSLLKK